MAQILWDQAGGSASGASGANGEGGQGERLNIFEELGRMTLQVRDDLLCGVWWGGKCSIAAQQGASGDVLPGAMRLRFLLDSGG